jgi:hypothetical protein
MDESFLEEVTDSSPLRLLKTIKLKPMPSTAYNWMYSMSQILTDPEGLNPIAKGQIAYSGHPTNHVNLYNSHLIEGTFALMIISTLYLFFSVYFYNGEMGTLFIKNLKELIERNKT